MAGEALTPIYTIYLTSPAEKLTKVVYGLDTDNHRHKARGVLQLRELRGVKVEFDAFTRVLGL